MQIPAQISVIWQDNKNVQYCFPETELLKDRVCFAPIEKI